jgi:hypothetical protein
MEDPSMRIARALLVLPLSLLIAVPSPAFADQHHIVSPAGLAAVVADRVATRDANRAAIAEALAQPRVRRVARSMGVDPSRLEAAASALTGIDLERASKAAQDVNRQLVGGANSITVSTTTIIIILLVVILIIVAVKG